MIPHLCHRVFWFFVWKRGGSVFSFSFFFDRRRKHNTAQKATRRRRIQHIHTKRFVLSSSLLHEMMTTDSLINCSLFFRTTADDRPTTTVQERRKRHGGGRRRDGLEYVVFAYRGTASSTTTSRAPARDVASTDACVSSDDATSVVCAAAGYDHANHRGTYPFCGIEPSSTTSATTSATTSPTTPPTTGAPVWGRAPHQRRRDGASRISVFFFLLVSQDGTTYRLSDETPGADARAADVTQAV